MQLINAKIVFQKNVFFFDLQSSRDQRKKLSWFHVKIKYRNIFTEDFMPVFFREKLEKASQL